MSTSRVEISQFLQDFQAKLSIWGIIYRDDRNKNLQSLLTLDILPARRTELLKTITVEDFVEGPLRENLYGGADMWVFGKTIRQHEVYIKITLGFAGRQVICISFHIAERPLLYPLKS
ncbi:MAG: toxin [Bacteroidetes bacterium]|nr:MAG: toxin [Bacteroidota bacterium]